MQSAQEAAKYQRDLNAQNASKVVAELKKSGMQVIENVDMAPFQKIVSDAIAKAIDSGSATTPTMTPATMFGSQWCLA